MDMPHTTSGAGLATGDLQLLTDAVRAAGNLAMGYFGKAPRSRRKPDGTEVSEADLAVDAYLRETLLAARPNHGWLSEETADDPARLARDRVWVVDPIDGTRAFLREEPEWTIAAALVEDARPLIAAVYNPARGELFHAVRDGGSFLNGSRIRIGDRDAIEGSSMLVSGGLLRRRDWHEPWPPVKRLWVNSIAYRLALVAAGRHDATISLSNKSEWDLAAADLLVQEAGGRVTTHAGEALFYNRPRPELDSVVAAGPVLHGLIVDRTRRLDLRR